MSYRAVDTTTRADEEELQRLEEALAASPDTSEGADRHEQEQDDDELTTRCRTIVRRLQYASFEERIEVYKSSTYRELAAASGRYPELMPIANDEFEWIELLLADHRR